MLCFDSCIAMHTYTDVIYVGSEQTNYTQSDNAWKYCIFCLLAQVNTSNANISTTIVVSLHGSKVV